MIKPSLYCFIVSLLCIGCAVSDSDLFPLSLNEPSRVIYLINHGNHAGIVVKRSDISENIWPEHNEFKFTDYLEVGWGEKDYYQMTDPHWGMALKAAMWPTDSVLHIVGFNGPVTGYFPYSEIIKIKLTYQGFERLCNYINASYAKNDKGETIILAPGQYGYSRFYLSRGLYHLFNTCNVWTAKALRAAGCPITPALSIMVDSLMSHAASFGIVIQAKKP